MKNVLKGGKLKVLLTFFYCFLLFSITFNHVVHAVPQNLNVIYDGNGNTGGSVPTDSNVYALGDNVTVKGNVGNLVKTEYVFIGWNTKADGTGTDYIAGGTFSITDNTKLYAKWSPIVRTIAGSGDYYYTDDSKNVNVPAITAQVNYPTGITLDKDGNVYFVDYGHDRIRKIDTNGIITTAAGNGHCGYSGDNGPAISAEINDVEELAFDSSGNLYFSDCGNNRIRMIDKNGTITTVAGTGDKDYYGDNKLATEAHLNCPRGIAFDSKGNLYIADSNNNRIRKVDASTKYITTIAGNGVCGTSGNGVSAALNWVQVGSPYGIAFDKNDNLYISDYADRIIRKVDINGIITTIAGTGDSGYTGDGGQAVSAKLGQPYDIKFDSNGNLYYADYLNNCIRKINSKGIITTVVGNGDSGYSEGAANSAVLSHPSYIAIDSGYLYISDSCNHRVRKVNISSMSTLDYVLDNIAPVITLNGDNPVKVEVGAVYTDAGATAVDTVDGNVTVTADTSKVDTSKVGTYAVTYTATDKSGNIAKATRNVEVVAPSTPIYTPPYIPSAPTEADKANDSISTAVSLIPSTFTAAHGKDTNLIGSLNAISGMSATGTTITIVSSNTNVANDGTITYTKDQVTGNVVVHINKAYGTEQTKTIQVIIPAYEENPSTCTGTVSYGSDIGNKNVQFQVVTETNSTETVTVKYDQAVQVQQPSGTSGALDSSKVSFTTSSNSTVQVTADGNIKIDNLQKGTNYTYEVTYSLNGTTINIGTIQVNVDSNGTVALTICLIDPYGKITDADTGAAIVGANVTLYYADTAKNRAANVDIGKLVKLPAITGFDPNDNNNPQVSDSNGAYGYMVFPDTDYYIVATEDGYNDYTSPTISVGKDIVKFDFKMTKKNTSSTVERLAGDSRIDTAIEIAKATYTGKVSNVVLATASDYPDALAGSVLAYKLNAPILLVGNSDEDQKKVLDYIKANMDVSGTVYILGGSGAVSKDMEDKISASGYTNITRLAGANRYETSVKIAEAIGTKTGTPIVLVSGDDYPDALSISSTAAIKQYPILLVSKNGSTDEVLKEIVKINPSKIYIIGLQGAVNSSAETEISKAINIDASNIVRIGGQDRFETSLKVAKYFNLSGNISCVATGNSFPDALAGSLYAAKNNAPILLAGSTLSDDEMSFLKDKNVTGTTIFGGEGAVSKNIYDQLLDLLKIQILQLFVKFKFVYFFHY